MNKKIFTLLMGAIIAIGSVFTASAQTLTVNHKEAKKYLNVYFADTLRADSVKYFKQGNNETYVLSVTGIANPLFQNNNGLPTSLASLANRTASVPTRQLSYVLFVDSIGQLRMDSLAVLDRQATAGVKANGGYNIPYRGSSKFGALRQSLWCATVTDRSSVAGSNVVFNFNNMGTGDALQVPMPNTGGTWKNAYNEAYDRQVYDSPVGLGSLILAKKGIYMKNPANIVSDWHFSQTYASDQALQENMPLYAYTSRDTVLVFVLDTAIAYEKPHYESTPAGNPSTGELGGSGAGGWKVTVKKVAVADLIVDAAGHVNTGAKAVNNVLIFTLKKIDRFVLNAHDYNAVNDKFSFNPNAYSEHNSADRTGWNPFTNSGKSGNGIRDPHDHGLVAAMEVQDSLYKYGYVYFANVSAFSVPTTNGTKDTAAYLKNLGEKWLRVDTSFWNVGNNDDNHLSFKWGHIGDSSLKSWGYSGSPKYAQGTFNSPQNAIYNRDSVFLTRPDFASAPYWSTHNTDTIALFLRDSARWHLAYNTDSLMDNQMKFRVIYDPHVDSTWINVYQTRRAYTDWSGSKPVEPNWWENSFDTLGAAANNAQVKRPSASRGGDTTNYSFRGKFPNSSPTNMDKVLISTADTNIYFNNTGIHTPARVINMPLSYIYPGGDSTNTGNSQGSRYRDSLLYVNIQNLHDGTNNKVTTITQASTNSKSAKVLETQIKLDLGRCPDPGDAGKALIPNDLYLIRNELGQFLAVPIWSITDSVYWITPSDGENPVLMPSYQWAVESIELLPISKDGYGSAFKLTNREFEKVQFTYAYVPVENASNGDKLTVNIKLVGTHSSARFASERKVSRGVWPNTDAKLKEDGLKPADWPSKVDAILPMGKNGTSWFRIDKSVKSDQLLGYTYKAPDETVVDIYALKYLNGLVRPENARYLGWNGYKEAAPGAKRDTVVYSNVQDYVDRLYFQLNEMPHTVMENNTKGVNSIANGGKTKDELGGYQNLYDTRKDTAYQSIFRKYYVSSIDYSNKNMYLERFGYMPVNKNLLETGRSLVKDPHNSANPSAYDYSSIADLRPLARQAYKLLLKDYYKFSPTVHGDYMTVGQQDNYILADQLYAAQKYVKESGRVEGLFGVPYFYFRNTFFNIEGLDDNGTKVNEDYFALIQRIDTVSDRDQQHFGSKFDDLTEYVRLQWGEKAATSITNQVTNSHELGAFIAVVEEATAKLKIAVRGDNAVRLSTFTLVQDNDPIYRRFTWNDRFPRVKNDDPRNLEFHRVNNPSEKLFENSGAGRFGDGGGHDYNLVEYKNGSPLKRDSLNNIISFLGYRNEFDFPATKNPSGYTTADSTNFVFYVDTAYVNRGTGWIKPQYMLAVDVYGGQAVDDGNCHCEKGPDFVPYVLGRYLFNSSMYSKEWRATNERDDYYKSKTNIYDKTWPVNKSILRTDIDAKRYVSNMNDYKYDRLAFSWAIHRGDELIVLKTNMDPTFQGYIGDPQAMRAQLIIEYPDGRGDINWDKLKATRGDNKAIPAGKKIAVHAIVDLANNHHKDWVFSFRYIERRSDDFVIESETEERDWTVGNDIRPGWSGWVKIDNGVPVITRTDTKELMGESELFNVNQATVASVGNDKVSETSSIAVSGGTGKVTILNATGKRVVISNMLGQTVVNTVLSSNNASVAVPTGVVVVVVEGENAVKAVVK